MIDAHGVPRSLPLSAIEVEEGFNPRTTSDGERQAQLVESVRRHGILQAVLVAPSGEGEGFRVVAGHRRLAAAAAIGLMEVPAVVREPAAGEAEALAVIENLQREDLNPIDEARGFEQAMKARRLNPGQLAEELSVPASRISDRLGLLRLPDEVQARIASGTVSPRCASLWRRSPRSRRRSPKPARRSWLSGTSRPRRLRPVPAGWCRASITSSGATRTESPRAHR